MMKAMRQLFIRGLFSLVPILATVYVIYFLFTLLDNFLGRYIVAAFGKPLPGIGLVTSIFLIFMTGFLVTNVIGVKLFAFIERMLNRIPIAPKIYFGVKQIIHAFSSQGKQMFNRVVLVEYPRKGIYVVGFMTGKCRGEIQEKIASGLVNVFIPTTPNPTSGMLVLVPEEELVILDMNVEDGLKLIISAGVVIPERST